MTIVIEKPLCEAKSKVGALRRKSDSDIEFARPKHHQFQRSLSVPVLSTSVIPVESQTEVDQSTRINDVFRERENCSTKSGTCIVILNTADVHEYLDFYFYSRCSNRLDILVRFCTNIKDLKYSCKAETSRTEPFPSNLNTKATLFMFLLILFSSYTGRVQKKKNDSLLYVKDHTQVRRKRRFRRKTVHQLIKDCGKLCKYDNLDKCVSNGSKESLHSFMYSLFGKLTPCQKDIIISPVDGSGLDSFFQSFGNGMSLEDGMNFEWVRLRSFATFRCIANVSPIVLSRSGFFYSGRDSEVKCYSCGATYNQWGPNDSVLDIHRRISPNCRHLNGSDERNVPVQHRTISRPNERQNNNYSISVSSPTQLATNGAPLQSAVSAIPLQSANRNQHQNNSEQPSDGHREITGRATMSSNRSSLDARGNFAQNHTRTTEARPSLTGSRPNDLSNARPLISTNTANPSGNSSVSSATVNKLSPLGVNFDKPCYPQYAVLTVRMSTYNGWPATQIPRKMAEAGFIYAGYADYTRCFFCGGGLRNWEEGDDPWIEHARWFPRCAYVRQNKGEQFIQLVHERLQEMISGTMTSAARGMELQYQTHVPKQHEINGSGSASANDDHLHVPRADIKSLPSYQSVLELGYAPDMVENVIQQLLRQGKEEITSNDILEVIFQIEDGSSSTSETISANHTQSNKDYFDETETSQIMEENRRLREQRLCMICVEKDSCIAFLPCGHLVCCQDCAPAMRKCPKCQQIVQGSIKTWLV